MSTRHTKIVDLSVVRTHTKSAKIRRITDESTPPDMATCTSQISSFTDRAALGDSPEAKLCHETSGSGLDPPLSPDLRPSSSIDGSCAKIAGRVVEFHLLLKGHGKVSAMDVRPRVVNIGRSRHPTNARTPPHLVGVVIAEA